MFLDLFGVLVRAIQWAQGPILFTVVLAIMVLVAGFILVRQWLRNDLGGNGAEPPDCRREARFVTGLPEHEGRTAATHPLSLQRGSDGKFSLR